MQDIHACVLYGEHQSAAFLGGNGRINSFELDDVHVELLCVKPNITADAQLVAIRKFRSVWALQDQFTDVTVSE